MGNRRQTDEEHWETEIREYMNETHWGKQID